VKYRKFKFSDLKEVNKVKKEIDFNKIPYFETKVIKLKKEKREWKPGYCPCCGKKTEEPEANIVNGENLDKIMFPCFCSYHETNCTERYGMLNKGCNHQVDIFELHKIEQQSDFLSREDHNLSLEYLMKHYNIKILKGKIIIFEEEK
jgi:hypothetical protein